ncbi:glycerophosphodiester phosphodiesterase [Ureibacillus thermophilus]|uniref:Glycerophosphodiester phosphodiesterase n=1 Tax=Ureibacillus thermophilus TaxID=367743 RepID=A0A4P6URW9_9BACL|nr:glycerophosphodiester phosphodiesterase [Ureibacillus thermophilus]QBK24648.1 glycerophosphodiester phosphodiesterase [Ureibacillus thermophilus]
MQIFAHRGYSSKYPENTLAAFEAAAKLDITGVELDVHLTKDRQVVVIHDEKINRTSNGKGFVKDMTLKELRQFDFGSWFNKKFRGEKIPTLAEVLDLLKNTSHKINIELKSDKIIYPGLEELVLREAENFRLKDRVIISSFDHEAVKRMVELAPDIESAPLFSYSILNMKGYRTLVPAKAFHVAYRAVARRPVLEAIKAGIPVRVYTINNKEQVDILRHLGVEGIITDCPEEMNEMLKLSN